MRATRKVDWIFVIADLEKVHFALLDRNAFLLIYSSVVYVSASTL